MQKLKNFIANLSGILLITIISFIFLLSIMYPYDDLIIAIKDLLS